METIYYAAWGAAAAFAVLLFARSYRSKRRLRRRLDRALARKRFRVLTPGGARTDRATYKQCATYVALHGGTVIYDP